jgi:hypothetical protein
MEDGQEQAAPQPMAQRDARRCWTGAEAGLTNPAAQPEQTGAPATPPLRMTQEEIKALRTACRADPRCTDEHWFVLMARAIEDRCFAAHSSKESQ